MSEALDDARKRLSEQLAAYAQVTGMSDQRRMYLEKTYTQRNTTVESINALTDEWRESTKQAKIFKDTFNSVAQNNGLNPDEAWKTAMTLKEPFLRRLVDGQHLSDHIAGEVLYENVGKVVNGVRQRIHEVQMAQANESIADRFARRRNELQAQADHLPAAEIRSTIQPQAAALLDEMARAEARGALSEGDRDRVLSRVSVDLVPQSATDAYQEKLGNAEREVQSERLADQFAKRREELQSSVKLLPEEESKKKIQPKVTHLLEEIATQEVRGALLEKDRDWVLQHFDERIMPNNAREVYNAALARTRNANAFDAEEREMTGSYRAAHAETARLASGTPDTATTEDRGRLAKQFALSRDALQAQAQGMSQNEIEKNIHPQAIGLMERMAAAEARGDLTERDRDRVLARVGYDLVPGSASDVYLRKLAEAKPALNGPGQQQAPSAPAPGSQPKPEAKTPGGGNESRDGLYEQFNAQMEVIRERTRDRGYVNGQPVPPLASAQEIKESLEPKAIALLEEVARAEARGALEQGDGARIARKAGLLIQGQNPESWYEQKLAEAKAALTTPNQQAAPSGPAQTGQPQPESRGPAGSGDNLLASIASQMPPELQNAVRAVMNATGLGAALEGTQLQMLSSSPGTQLAASYEPSAGGAGTQQPTRAQGR
jgi:hypothetical protein